MKKIFTYSIMALLSTFAISSCSDDEDRPAPDLDGITMDNVSPLNEAGVLTATFTATTADARIASASTTTKGFAVEKVESKGNGIWQVTVKATDFAYVQNGQTVDLTVAQADGINASAVLNVNDPFSIENRYTLAYPYTYSLTDAATKKAIDLPLIINAADEAELANISGFMFIHKPMGNTSVTANGWKAEWFELSPMEDGKGAYLTAKQEAVDKMATQKTPQSLSTFCVAAVAKNGRMQLFPLTNVYACCSETILKNDALQVTAADLKESGYEKHGTFDASGAMNRIGIFGSDRTQDIDWKNISSTVLHTLAPDGKPLENDNFFVSYIMFPERNANYYFSGEPEADYQPGTYLNVERYTLDWKYNGKTYPRISADLQYEIVIK
jgi:hypothetical protein